MSRIKKTLFTFLFVAALSATSAIAQTVTNPTFPPLTNFLYGNTSVNAVGKTSYVSGSGLPYRYLLPKNFNSNVKYPVIIYLHGSGESGTDNNAQLAASNNTAHGALALVSIANPDNQTNYPCFFIAPQTTTNISWSSDTAASAIENILDTLATQYPHAIDTARIYITGNSMGGFGTYDIPALLSQSNHLGYNPFAAMVPMSGQLDRSVSAEPKMPIWVFHGAQDVNVPIATSDDESVPQMRSDGWSVIYSRYTNGTHDIWELAYQHPLLVPWLFAQKQDEADAPLSNFAVSGATKTASAATVSGTASTAAGFTSISWSNTANDKTGSDTSALSPTWSLPNIPLTEGSNPLQVTATAPNNIGTVFGGTTNYGGNTTVNLTYTVTPTSSSGSGTSNLALGKQVTASSVENSSLDGGNAVDGNNSTRWGSGWSDSQWIVVDLGASYSIREIDLNWETAAGKNYLIQTSTNNTTWTTRTTVTGNTTSGLHTYTYSNPTVRYIRIYGTARATMYGYSLYEISVYSTTGSTSGLSSGSTGTSSGGSTGTTSGGSSGTSSGGSTGTTPPKSTPPKTTAPVTPAPIHGRA